MILMSGTELRKKKLLELKEKIQKLNRSLGLVVIEVGNDPASQVYVRQKQKLAESLGYNFFLKKLNETVTEEELISEIKKLNELEEVDGIIVQLPLPKHLNSNKIVNMISPLKDVDGLNIINAGKLVHKEEGLIPCTPKGIIDLLDEYKITLEGKNVVVLGRSILVGMPISILLNERNATVTMCHSKTINLEEYTKNADILVVAVGKEGIITGDMIKEGAVIIDVGINRGIDGKLHGDVLFESVKDKVSYITPVPGGVGPMTVYELCENVYKAHELTKKM